MFRHIGTRAVGKPRIFQKDAGPPGPAEKGGDNPSSNYYHEGGEEEQKTETDRHGHWKDLCALTNGRAGNQQPGKNSVIRSTGLDGCPDFPMEKTLCPKEVGEYKAKRQATNIGGATIMAQENVLMGTGELVNRIIVNWTGEKPMGVQKKRRGR